MLTRCPRGEREETKLIGQRIAWRQVHCVAFSAKWTKVKILQFECAPERFLEREGGEKSLAANKVDARNACIGQQMKRPSNHWPHVLLPLPSSLSLSLSDHVTVIWPSFCRINFSCNICLRIVLPRFQEGVQPGDRGERSFFFFYWQEN